MFLVHALRPVIAGVVLGTAASVVLTRFVGSLLFNVAATDATNYAVAALMLASCALVASYLPVRRVLRSDPSRVIRE